MKYTVDFQHLPAGSQRPIDDGEVFPIETDDQGFNSIPNVGDFVSIQGDPDKDQHPGFHGKVRSRLFTYLNHSFCHVNIIVEETNDDWGKLIKQ